MANQHILPFTWPQRYDRESFVLADTNLTAFSAATECSKWSSFVTIIQGPQASGKSHLHAIFLETHSPSIRVEIKADMDQAIEAKETFIAVDNIDVLLDSDRAAQESLFHLYNACIANKRYLFLTTTQPISNLSLLLDLKSRLLASNNIVLQNPDETILKQTFQKLFNDRSLFVDERVIDYMILRNERSFAGMAYLVECIDKAALASKRRVTIPLLQELGF
jgi:chromosomal replication initiation ATPase DnaA